MDNVIYKNIVQTEMENDEEKLKISDSLIKLPKQIYERGYKLKFLDLSNNNLKELPNEFSRLINLEIAFFSNNEFNKFPTVLSECCNLTMIAFRHNKICDIVENSFPKNLEWLILTDNLIEKLPKSIGKCVKLKKLMLSGNKLIDLPHELKFCKNLELLRLSNNNLTQLPSFLFSLPKLSWFSYFGNNITTFSPLNSLKEYNPNNFIIKEQIGEGASGCTFKAYSKDLNKDIALKIFKHAMTSDGSPQNEIYISNYIYSVSSINSLFTIHNISHSDNISHPHIIPIIGIINNYSDKTHALLLELISGFNTLGDPPNFKTCTRDIITRSFSLDNIITICIAIISVSDYLHSYGVNHGDLYAHNIIVNDNCNSYLCDLGASSLYDKDSLFAAFIEKIEVRAFGCLLDDLLNNHDNSPIDNSSYCFLNTLRDNCLQSNISQRPSFSDIKRIFTYKFSSSIN